jgi:hypothetical protein
VRAGLELGDEVAGEDGGRGVGAAERRDVRPRLPVGVSAIASTVYVMRTVEGEARVKETEVSETSTQPASVVSDACDRGRALHISSINRREGRCE